MSVKLKREKGGITDRLLKNLQKLDKESVEVGHFASQGTHSSGMTYPELLALWDYGVVEGHEGTVRSPLLAYDFDLRAGGDKSAMNQSVKQWSRNAEKPSANLQLLSGIGDAGRQSYKDKFGIVGLFMPPDSTGTPMFETGELKQSTAYKTTIDKVVKEG